MLGDFRRHFGWHDLDFNTEGACFLISLAAFIDLRGTFRRLAHGPEAARPGAGVRNEADMADDRNALIGHAFHRCNGCRAIDGIGAGAHHFKAPAQEAVNGSVIGPERKSRHGKEARSNLAEPGILEQLRRHRNHVDAGGFRGFELFPVLRAHHGVLEFALVGADVRDRRFPAGHRKSYPLRSDLSCWPGSASTSTSGLRPLAIIISASLMSRAIALPGPMPLAPMSAPSEARWKRMIVCSLGLRATVTGPISGTPAICRLSSYWSDQNQGTVVCCLASPSMFSAAVVA